MRSVILIDKSGNVTDNEKHACARFVDNQETGKQGYYLKYGDGILYHPKLSSVEEQRIQWKMLKVSEEKYKSYLKFLQTKNEVIYRRLER